MLRSLLPLFALVALLASGGCAYRLGSTNGQAAGERSVSVRPFENRTDEPRVSDAISVSLRRELQQDGTYRLETWEDGDIVISGVARDLQLLGLSFISGDIATVEDYEATLVVDVEAINRRTGKVVFNRQFHGRTTFRFEGDLNNSKRQAVPLMCADVARKITFELVDGGW